jgi:hypothetical protein
MPTGDRWAREVEQKEVTDFTRSENRRENRCCDNALFRRARKARRLQDSPQDYGDNYGDDVVGHEIRPAEAKNHQRIFGKFRCEQGKHTPNQNYTENFGLSHHD